MSWTQYNRQGEAERTTGITVTTWPQSHGRPQTESSSSSHLRETTLIFIWLFEVRWNHTDFYLTFWNTKWLSNLPVRSNRSAETWIWNNWVRAAVVIMSDAVRCWGDPFQLCLETQSARERERERERKWERERRAGGSTFFFPPDKIGRLFSLSSVSTSSALLDAMETVWTQRQLRGKTNKENTRQLAPIIGTGVCVSA